MSNCVLLFFLSPVLLGAIAKSARAAGISATQADKYASNLLNRLPGN
jgi:multisubunit Na+/H+ antiporter MnhG subunit